MYFFIYYITIKVALPVSGLRIIRIFNYTYYNSILCLYILIPADLFIPWGIDLFSRPRISSTGIFGPEDRFIGPPDRFRGDRIPRDTGPINGPAIRCINV